MKRKSGNTKPRMGYYTQSFKTAPARPKPKTVSSADIVRHLDRPGLVGMNPWAPGSVYDKIWKGGDK